MKITPEPVRKIASKDLQTNNGATSELKIKTCDTLEIDFITVIFNGPTT